MTIIKLVRELDAPVGKVFELFSDHANFSRLPGIAESELVRAGSAERNGVGAQRRLKVGANMIWEDIVGFRRDELIEYRIVKMQPNIVHHVIGRQQFERLGASRTRVTWTSEFHVRIPLIGWLLEPLVRKQFEKGFSVMLHTAGKLAAKAA